MIMRALNKLLLLSIFSICIFLIDHNYTHILLQTKQPEVVITEQKTITPPALPEGNSSFKGNKRACFKSITQTTSLQELAYTGELPSWLQGMLIATGPGRFELGPSQAAYWFNGLALLHGFYFEGKTISYHNNFLESICYKRCLNNGKLDSDMCNEKPKGFFSRLASAALSTPPPYDNGNLAIAHINDSYIALTETTLGVRIDPKTLQTIDSFDLNDYFDGHLTTCQFMYDRYNEAWYNYALNFGTTSSYVLYKVTKDLSAEVLSTVSVKLPAYMRSFAMTKNYLILIEIPFVVNPMDLLLGAGTFIEKIKWKPTLGTKFLVFNKKNGNLCTTITTKKPFFIFNTINAYESHDNLIIDAIAYNDTSVIACTKLETLQSNNQHEFEPSYALRFCLNLKKQTLNYSTLCTAQTVESPSIHQSYTMEPYTYVYGLSSSQPYKFPHQIIKLNTTNNTFLLWQEEGCYANKPLFVAKPGAQAQDEGVVISVITNSITQKSFLLILDATNFKELARADIPCTIPLGFVGTFSLK